ncbi:MAG: PQQ-binding-like beta-propeller repeat protein [Candidatus Caldarchaeum sp.]
MTNIISTRRIPLLYVVAAVILNVVVFQSAHAQPSPASCLNTNWTRSLSAPTSGGVSSVGAMVVDASGDIYITGATPGSGLNESDWVVLRLAADGSLRWRRLYDNSGQTPDRPSADEGRAIAFDAFGNLYVTGISTSNTATDFLTIKYNPAGEVIWERRYNGAPIVSDGLPIDEPASIQVRESKVIVAGTSTNETGRQEFTILYYDLDGQLNREVRRSDFPAGKLAVDAQGNVYVLTESSDPAYLSVLLLVKYSPEGDLIWEKRHRTAFPDRLVDRAVDIATDAHGNVYILGETTRVDRYTYPDIAIIKYSSDGVLRWEKSYGSTYVAYARPIAITVTPDNFLVVAGDYIDNAINAPLVMRYTQDGARQWQQIYLTDGNYTTRSLSIDRRGDVYLVGSQTNSLIILRYASAGVLRSVERNDDAAPLLATIDPHNYFLLIESRGDDIGLRKLTPDRPNSEITFVYIDGLLVEEEDGDNSIDTYGVVRANLSRPAQNDLSLQFFILRNDPYSGRIDFEPDAISIYKGRIYGEKLIRLTPANREVDPPRQVQLNFICHPEVNITNPRVSVAIWDDDFVLERSPVWLTTAPWAGRVTGLYTDLAGNIYFGTSGGMTLQKFNPSGQLLWRQSRNGVMFAMPVNHTGDIAVAGLETLNSATHYAVHVYDSEGNLKWSHFARGTYKEGNVADSAAFDQNGNLYVAGTLYNVYKLPNHGQVYRSDLILTKYDSQGQILWEKRMSDGPNGSFSAAAVGVDTGGNVLLAASYASGGREVGLLLKYDANGSLLWQRETSGPGVSSAIRSLALRNDDAVAVQVQRWQGDHAQQPIIVVWDASGFPLWEVGCWLNPCGMTSIRFDSFGRLYFASLGAIFIYSAQGDLERLIITDMDFVSDFVVDPDGTAYAIGASSGRLTLGAYNLRGHRLWRQTIASSNRGISILKEANGNLLLTGEFSLPADPVPLSALALGRQSPPFGNPEASVASIVVVEAQNNTAQAHVEVRLSSPVTQPISLTYSTVAGAALPGEDYIDAAGVITIPTGARTATIPITILSDEIEESPETFFVNFGGYRELYIDRPQATVVILDRNTRFAFLPLVRR